MTCFKIYLFFPALITKLAHFSKQSPEESMVTEKKKWYIGVWKKLNGVEVYNFSL